MFIENTVDKITLSDKLVNNLMIDKDSKVLITNNENVNGVEITLGDKTEVESDSTKIQSLSNRDIVLGHSFWDEDITGISSKLCINSSDECLFIDYGKLVQNDIISEDGPFDNSKSIERLDDNGCLIIRGNYEKLNSKVFFNNTFFASIFTKMPDSVEFETDDDGNNIKYAIVEYSGFMNKSDLTNITLYNDNNKLNLVIGSGDYELNITSEDEVLTKDEWINIIFDYDDKNSSYNVYVNNENILSGTYDNDTDLEKNDIIKVISFPNYVKTAPEGVLISQCEVYFGLYDTDDYDYITKNILPIAYEFDISNQIESEINNMCCEIYNKKEFSISDDIDDIDDHYEEIERDYFEIVEVTENININEYFYKVCNKLYNVFNINKDGNAFKIKITANKNYILNQNIITYLN
jgi:hypothetical protein